GRGGTSAGERRSSPASRSSSRGSAARGTGKSQRGGAVPPGIPRRVHTASGDPLSEVPAEAGTAGPATGPFSPLATPMAPPPQADGPFPRKRPEGWRREG